MEAFTKGVDPFEGVRIFPRDPEQLLHHLSRINHSLQTRYFIAPEIAEFALHPDKSADFQKFYQKEVQQIIAHLNKTTRSNIRVRVDGARIAKGMEIIRNATKNYPKAHRSGSSSVSSACELTEVDATWQASMVSTSKKLAEQHAVHYQCVRANAADGVDVTPAGATPRTDADLLMTAGHAPGADIVDSMAKPNKDSFMFSTPPEFKGFHNGPHASPSASNGRSPAGY